MKMPTPTGLVANDLSGGHHHSPKVYFDQSYFRSSSGILKIAQAIVSILGYICMKVFTKHYHFPAGSYYEFVTFVAFFVSIITGGLHLFHVTDVSNHLIPWLLVELIFSLLWSFLYCIAGGILASWASFHSSLAASCFFAFVATVLYGYEGVEKSKRKLRGDGRGDPQRSRGGSCATITIN